jgi:hypothetical protein
MTIVKTLFNSNAILHISGATIQLRKSIVCVVIVFFALSVNGCGKEEM